MGHRGRTPVRHSFILQVDNDGTNPERSALFRSNNFGAVPLGNLACTINGFYDEAEMLSAKDILFGFSDGLDPKIENLPRYNESITVSQKLNRKWLRTGLWPEPEVSTFHKLYVSISPAWRQIRWMSMSCIPDRNSLLLNSLTRFSVNT